MKPVSEKILKLIPTSLSQISFEQAVNLFLLECNNKNLSQRTVHWYKTRIDYFANQEVVLHQNRFSPTDKMEIKGVTSRKKLFSSAGY